MLPLLLLRLLPHHTPCSIEHHAHLLSISPRVLPLDRPSIVTAAGSGFACLTAATATLSRIRSISANSSGSSVPIESVAMTAQFVPVNDTLFRLLVLTPAADTLSAVVRVDLTLAVVVKVSQSDNKSLTAHTAFSLMFVDTGAVDVAQPKLNLGCAAEMVSVVNPIF